LIHSDFSLTSTLLILPVFPAASKLKYIGTSTDDLFAMIGMCMENYPENEIIIQCLISVLLTLGAASRGTPQSQFHNTLRIIGFNF
jgi:hypothetical protein